MWTVLNSFVALCGYYVAAFTIDKPWMGRTRMQAMGFMWIGFLFLMCKCSEIVLYLHLPTDYSLQIKTRSFLISN